MSLKKEEELGSHGLCFQCPVAECSAIYGHEAEYVAHWESKHKPAIEELSIKFEKLGVAIRVELDGKEFATLFLQMRDERYEVQLIEERNMFERVMALHYAQRKIIAQIRALHQGSRGRELRARHGEQDGMDRELDSSEAANHARIKLKEEQKAFEKEEARQDALRTAQAQIQAAVHAREIFKDKMMKRKKKVKDFGKGVMDKIRGVFGSIKFERKSFASKNRSLQHSNVSGYRSQIPSVLPTSNVQDFAYPTLHPMHYGPPKIGKY